MPVSWFRKVPSVAMVTGPVVRLQEAPWLSMPEVTLRLPLTVRELSRGRVWAGYRSLVGEEIDGFIVQEHVLLFQREPITFGEAVMKIESW